MGEWMPDQDKYLKTLLGRIRSTAPAEIEAIESEVALLRRLRFCCEMLLGMEDFTLDPETAMVADQVAQILDSLNNVQEARNLRGPPNSLKKFGNM